MDFLAQNIEAIQKHRPLLYRTLSNYFKTKPSPTPLSIDGDFTNIEIATETGAKKFYAETPDKTWLESLKLSKIEKARIVIMHGFGLGYHLEKFFSTVASTVKHTLIVEKNIAVFATALKLTDLTSYFKRDDVEFFVGLPQNEFKRHLIDYLLNAERLIYRERLGHFYLTPAMEHDGPYYVALAQKLNEAVATASNAFTSQPEDNFLGLTHIVKNRERIATAPTIFPLKEKMTGTKAILVGAGPSLKDHYENLKKHGSKFLIGCCDAALLGLLSHGITPDFVTCAERTISQESLFADLPKNFKAPLFTLPSLHPKIYASYPGPVVMVGRMATYGNWLWEDLDFNAGLGVSTLTMNVLSYLGVSEIFMLGQNYAFDEKSGDAYAQGVSDYLNTADAYDIRANSCDVPGNSGKSVTTNRLWRFFLEEIQIAILQSGKRVVNVIDNQCGARIANAELLSPDLFWKSASENTNNNPGKIFTDLVNAQKPDENEPARLEGLFKFTLDYLDTMISDIYAAMAKISDDFFNNLMNHNRAEELLTLKDKHLKLWDDLRESVIAKDRRLFYLFINCVFGAKHIEILTERERLVVDDKNIPQFIYAYFTKTLEWFHHLGSWAMRLKILLRN